jgi:hypothetical protein
MIVIPKQHVRIRRVDQHVVGTVLVHVLRRDKQMLYERRWRCRLFLQQFAGDLHQVFPIGFGEERDRTDETGARYGELAPGSR